MARKNYIISDESLEILSEIVAAEGLKSETAAIEFLIQRYALQHSREEEAIQVAARLIREPLAVASAAGRSADQKLDILLDVLNSILVQQGYSQYYPTDKYVSTIIEQAKEQQKIRLAEKKQYKDDWRGRKK